MIGTSLAVTTLPAAWFIGTRTFPCSCCSENSFWDGFYGQPDLWCSQLTLAFPFNPFSVFFLHKSVCHSFNRFETSGLFKLDRRMTMLNPVDGILDSIS